jgi:hypothetical protein
MVEDFAQLLQTALGLRSAWRGPLLLARAVNKRGLRREARKVRLSLRLGDSARIRRIGGSTGHGVAAKAQREGRRCGGQGDSMGLVNIDLSILVAPSKANVILNNLGRKR